METKIVHELRDLTYLSWTKTRKSSGTAGSFLKAYEKPGKTKIYYKMSNYSQMKGITGHECINEIIADRLLTVLGIPHLHYQLYHAEVMVNDEIYETYVCASEDFKEVNESKLALDTYYEVESVKNESMLDFCVRNGWAEYIYQMLVFDFLILNRDRHGANIEILRDRKKKTIRLAPLFDHGLSFLFSCSSKEEIIGSDVHKDLRVQCCVGSSSVKENLNLIPKDKMPELNKLKESDREYIFSGIDGIMPDYWCDKIWEFIWERWKYYEDFCNKR